MDRATFLRNLRASKVALHPLQIPGWEGVIYLRPQTLGEIRDVLMRAPLDDEDPKAQVKRDDLFIARSIARLVRDEAGDLLFSADNDAEMRDLMAALADTGPAISKAINAAYNELNEPSTVEVTPEGNSPAGKSS